MNEANPIRQMTADEYRAHAEAWIGATDDPEELDARWKSERRLREGISQDDYESLMEFLAERRKAIATPEPDDDGPSYHLGFASVLRTIRLAIPGCERVVFTQQAREAATLVRHGFVSKQDAVDALEAAAPETMSTDEVQAVLAEAFAPHEDDGAEPEDEPQTESDKPEPGVTKPAKDLSAPLFSDEDLALRFAQRHKDDLRFVAAFGRWLAWHKTHWQFDDTLAAFNLARTLCRDVAAECNKRNLRATLASAKTVAACERLAKADRRLAATSDQWDVDPFLLVTPAGVVDLRTGHLRPARQSDYMTKITSVGPGGACPRWREFLRRITAGDAELEAFIQRMVGYGLTGVTVEHAMFFAYGTGANGKSVLLGTAAGILGDYHCTAPIEAFVASYGERHPTDLAGLRGARLVTAIETEEGRRWAENKLKALTGGDRISARFMRQDFFEFLPVFKLLVAGNHKPALRSVDEAIKRRLHLVPFTVTIPVEERNKNLAEELKGEWPGILTWMIEGCLQWQRIGLSPPEAVRAATEDYFADQDLLSQWLEEECDADPGNKFKSETVAALYESWCSYVRKHGGEPGGKNDFGDSLEGKGFTRHRSRQQGRHFRGIRLKYREGDAG